MTAVPYLSQRLFQSNMFLKLVNEMSGSRNSSGRVFLSRLETLFINFNFTKINEKNNNKSNISLIKSHEQRFSNVLKTRC